MIGIEQNSRFAEAYRQGAVGLVLEGGGMRGVFTSGVLDCFLDHDITFPYCASVSAGACNGLSYMSKQRGRAKKSNIDLLQKYRYIGMKYLWTQHSILDREFLYDKLPHELLPFDYAACFANPMEFEMAVTNCLTGKAEYLTDRSSETRLIQIAKATSSLPYVCPVVWVDHKPMLDGGIVDSIPVERAMAKGYALNVAVLTRNRGYRDTGRDIKNPPYIYRRFPRLRLALSKRHALYNRQLELVENLEDEGRLLAIRPKRPLEVGRLESNIDRLTALYEEGYECAEEALHRLTGM
ncbi:MAG: patatin family protein [Bacteroidales bacterium]|nr:patatin family protein [Bacteroidales bacterium]